MPVVSICLPNLNTRPFLDERLRTIDEQTFGDWELVIVDDYSTDGAWEVFEAHAAREPRTRLMRGPREGLYPGWNHAIRQARGEFVYIATSDDTMAPSCLEEMVAAARARPDAGIITVAIDCIDEHSRVIPGAWEELPGVRLFGEAIRRPHLRDGEREFQRMLRVGTTIISATAMLFRRELFERVGGFPVGVGPRGDYLWEMAAVRQTRLLHLPRKLATWRIHREQATRGDDRFAGWFLDQTGDIENVLRDEPGAGEVVAWRRSFVEAARRPGRRKGWMGRVSRRSRALLRRLGFPAASSPGFGERLAAEVRQSVGLDDLRFLEPDFRETNA